MCSLSGSSGPALIGFSSWASDPVLAVSVSGSPSSDRIKSISFLVLPMAAKHIISARIGFKLIIHAVILL